MQLPKKKIQNYNDGIAKIYSVTDLTTTVSKPVQKLTLKRELRFESRYVGYGRYYTAKQANVEISKIIRIQRQLDITTQDVVVLADGYQYRIEQKQSVLDVEPPSEDLTLTLIASPYAI